jgi:hypothetical protein
VYESAAFERIHGYVLTDEKRENTPPSPRYLQRACEGLFGTCGNGFVGEISTIEAPDTKEKETLYWHDGTSKLFRSNHFHYTPKDQIIIVCSNCSFLLRATRWF